MENAVKYGFCDIFEGGLIRISVTEQAGQLTFSVYNNGTPMEEQMAEKLNGLSEIPVSKMKDSFEDKKTWLWCDKYYYATAVKVWGGCEIFL